MQRLRRIKQLGATNLTFHGAEHSRFNHSLGVYEIVRRIIQKMELRPEWNSEERLVCLCAALLHDLGHGPFSHSFEKVFSLDHELFTEKIILGDTGVNKVLSQVAEDFPKDVANVINKTYHDKLVTSLISSQIDADRMDYLLRDAYYTGVSYGNFDMERILRVMRPTEDQVVIKSTGMHAVEDYIMSRYQMYWQVYFHPVTRSAEVILTKIFHRVKYLFENNYVLKDLAERFINRRLFKYKEYDAESHLDIVSELSNLFNKAGIDPDYYLIIDSSKDLPYDVYRSGGAGRVPIYLEMPNKKLKELSEHSTIVDSITGKVREDHKLYYPKDLIEKIPDETLKKEINTLLDKAYL